MIISVVLCVVLALVGFVVGRAVGVHSKRLPTAPAANVALGRFRRRVEYRRAMLDVLYSRLLLQARLEDVQFLFDKAKAAMDCADDAIREQDSGHVQAYLDDIDQLLPQIEQFVQMPTAQPLPSTDQAALPSAGQTEISLDTE